MARAAGIAPTPDLRLEASGENDLARVPPASRPIVVLAILTAAAAVSGETQLFRLLRRQWGLEPATVVPARCCDLIGRDEPDTVRHVGRCRAHFDPESRSWRGHWDCCAAFCELQPGLVLRAD